MSASYPEIPTFLELIPVESQVQLPTVTAEFIFTAEKPEPGLPGSKVGDVIQEKSEKGIRLIVSLGKEKKSTSDTFRQAGGSLARYLRQGGFSAFVVDLDKLPAASTKNSAALLEGLRLGAFQFIHYKTPAEPVVTIKAYLVSAARSELKKMVSWISRLTDSVNLCRDWEHEPANVINPVTLAERLAELTKDTNIKCTILDDQELAAMNAGGILNVGKGSASKPRMILLEYPGEGDSQGEKPIVLVGKALTFDTGGYSIKNAESIQTMKYDKCGGITVAAVIHAAAALKLKTPLVGIIGAAENMISGESYRPDDIITTLSGKTVEIISTDAEGRLVLADALTYAQKTYSPRAVIDLATLTGGVLVALGRVRAGVMGNDPKLIEALSAAGDATFERLWPLPLDEEFAALIKSDDADIKNSGGREGHSILGGMFLKEFVDDSTSWAHLDIAGMADTLKELPYCPKGATGFGVRLLIEYLKNQEA